MAHGMLVLELRGKHGLISVQSASFREFKSTSHGYNFSGAVTVAPSNAEGLTATLKTAEGETMAVFPMVAKEFSTGSCGFYGGGKVDGFQVGINLVLRGSKDGKRDGTTYQLGGNAVLIGSQAESVKIERAAERADAAAERALAKADAARAQLLALKASIGQA